MREIFSYLVFPGLFFSAAAGLFAGWLDRKISARIQWRVGPPWHQNFTDLVKLLGKEVIVPSRGTLTFLLSPYIGLLSLVLASTILGRAIIDPKAGQDGDLIVLLYLLVIPAISLIIGASSSRNPLASVGASREMKLVLGYEFGFILAVVAMVIRSEGSIRIGEIVSRQQFYGSNVFSFSGAIAFLVAVFCMQAKLGIVPFDASEAEQEIMGGVLIEYSGLPLAVFKLNKALLMYVMPVLLTALFLGRDLTPVFSVLKYVMLLAIAVLIKNTNPRLRIDQSLKFFWGPVAVMAVVAVALALKGY